MQMWSRPFIYLYIFFSSKSWGTSTFALTAMCVCCVWLSLRLVGGLTAQEKLLVQIRFDFSPHWTQTNLGPRRCRQVLFFFVSSHLWKLFFSPRGILLQMLQPISAAVESFAASDSCWHLFSAEDNQLNLRLFDVCFSHDQLGLSFVAGQISTHLTTQR